jgi:hypothetical protein
MDTACKLVSDTHKTGKTLVLTKGIHATPKTLSASDCSSRFFRAAFLEGFDLLACLISRKIV